MIFLKNTHFPINHPIPRKILKKEWKSAPIVGQVLIIYHYGYLLWTFYNKSPKKHKKKIPKNQKYPNIHNKNRKNSYKN